jgi:hypothetical protein
MLLKAMKDTSILDSIPASKSSHYIAVIPLTLALFLSGEKRPSPVLETL